MRFYNFSTYDAESEMPGGDYWKLLDANSLELEETRDDKFQVPNNKGALLYIAFCNIVRRMIKETVS